MAGLEFNTNFDPHYGQLVQVAPGIRRITANNPGPFTFKGTNTFVIGDGSVAVIDPGPDDPGHIQALLDGLSGETVRHILVTHTHRDHSPGARLLARLTGAPVYAEGPHRASRPLNTGEVNPLDASADDAFQPDIALRHGDWVEGDSYCLEAVFTPGHCANHMAFALPDRDILFCGDHVMAWSTSIVAPPDGSMADYMTSLDLLIERQDALIIPAHGAEISTPAPHLAGLRAHRLEREAAVLDAVQKGHADIPSMVEHIYKGLPDHLKGAAGLSVLAHLEDLEGRKRVIADPGPASVSAHYSVYPE
ncbi:MBL fold metallo-hydrolase [Coralliovum pocilloporae]|uniref:MBL fold metallo-hydrolase n=1 Tax=Coralliovum pocilloporae TaxID=3066369 RepID=UPI0033078514